MSLPNLTEEERAELVRLIREAIDGDRYFMSPRVRRLKSILAKIDPASVEHVGTPYPAPKPPGRTESSLSQAEGWPAALAEEEAEHDGRPRI